MVIPFSWYAFPLLTPLRRQREVQIKYMLGWKDSNLRVAVPKTAALPLGDTPMVHKDDIVTKAVLFCKRKRKKVERA